MNYWLGNIHILQSKLLKHIFEGEYGSISHICLYHIQFYIPKFCLTANELTGCLAWSTFPVGGIMTQGSYVSCRRDNVVENKKTPQFLVESFFLYTNFSLSCPDQLC